LRDDDLFAFSATGGATIPAAHSKLFQEDFSSLKKEMMIGSEAMNKHANTMPA